ncbi:SRPBCC family protein [Nocardia callitridis]|uniref:SRPBCC family protein n=1 Tax=Nocardia callitridis TaxID=648753 RepID=A0ABP9KHX8_9NOCA
MAVTRVDRHIRAPRATVYRLLLDPIAVAQWMVPTGMTSVVHEFEARAGGGFRISLTYDAPTEAGKTTARTDTSHGHFARLVPDQLVVQVVEFETADPALAGQQTITYTLEDADGGTLLRGVHEDLPDGVPPEDNELGWRISLDQLANLAEVGRIE